MLKVENLKKTYNDVTAVDDISFTVKDGSFVSIVGKSGSGKSTLLGLLGALDSPTNGSILIDEKDIARFRGKQLNEYRRQKIGFVFQSYNLVPNLSALENVCLPMEYLGNISKRDRQLRAEMLLQHVGLSSEKQHRKPSKLSGGEQQRVAIARALANHPSLILADEPTGNLDSETGSMIFELLKSLAREENTTIIVVTHDNDISKKTDQTLRISDGKIIIKGRGK